MQAFLTEEGTDDEEDDQQQRCEAEQPVAEQQPRGVHPASLLQEVQEQQQQLPDGAAFSAAATPVTTVKTASVHSTFCAGVCVCVYDNVLKCCC